MYVYVWIQMRCLLPGGREGGREGGVETLLTCSAIVHMHTHLTPVCLDLHGCIATKQVHGSKNTYAL